MKPSTFNLQNRGTIGKSVGKLRVNDAMSDFTVCRSHDHVLYFRYLYLLSSFGLLLFICISVFCVCACANIFDLSQFWPLFPFLLGVWVGLDRVVKIGNIN